MPDNLWFTQYDGNAWSADQQMKSSTDTHYSNQGPALAVLNDRVFCVHKSNSDNSIWWTQWDGSKWAAGTQLPASDSSYSPGLAVHEGSLYLGYHKVKSDLTSSQFVLWKFNGSNFADSVSVLGGRNRPAVVSYGGNMHRIYQSWIGNDVYFSSLGKAGWNAPKQIVVHSDIAKTDAGVCAAVYQGKIYMFTKGANETKIYYHAYSATDWGPSMRVPNAAALSAPGLAVYSGKLYCAWQGTQDNLQYASFDGNSWGPIHTFQDHKGINGIALVAYKDRIICTHQGG